MFYLVHTHRSAVTQVAVVYLMSQGAGVRGEATTLSSIVCPLKCVKTG